MRWFVRVGEASTGPFELAALIGSLRSGEVRPDALVCREGEIQWLPALAVPELAAALVSAVSEAESEKPSASTAAAALSAPPISMDGSAVEISRPVQPGAPEVGEPAPTTWITPIGATVAAGCFFLPWVKFSCAGVERHATGADVANGDNAVWLVLVSAIFIAGAWFVLHQQKRTSTARITTVAGAILGLGVLGLKYAALDKGQQTPFGVVRMQDLGLSVEPGGYGTVVGFTLALLGTMFSPTSPSAAQTVPASASSRPPQVARALEEPGPQTPQVARAQEEPGPQTTAPMPPTPAAAPPADTKFPRWFLALIGVVVLFSLAGLTQPLILRYRVRNLARYLTLPTAGAVTVTYNEHVEREGQSSYSTSVVEQTTEINSVWGERRFECTRSVAYPDGRVQRHTTRLFLNAHGFGYLGSATESGVYQAWEPPRLVLPPHVGERPAAWGESSRKGEQEVRDDCTTETLSVCSGGFTAVCTTTSPSGVQESREGYCPDIGLVSSTVSFRSSNTGRTTRIFVSNIQRGGVPSVPPRN